MYNTSWPGELENLSHKDTSSVTPLSTSGATGHISKDSFQNWEQEFVGGRGAESALHNAHSSPSNSQVSASIPSKLEKLKKNNH